MIFVTRLFATGCRRRRVAGALLASLLFAASGATLCAAGAALSPQAYKVLVKVHELMEQGEYRTAERRLGELLPQLAGRAYDRAIALQTLASAQAAREDYRHAAQSLRESLDLEALPSDTQQQARYDLAQLYLADDAPERAVSVLESWFEHADKPDGDAWFLLGLAQIQAKHYRRAIDPLQKAIAAVDNADETWYQALLAAHFELGDLQDCATVLETLVRLFPDRDYWQQLAGVYLALKQDRRALTTLELAWRQDRLSGEGDLLQLAQLYLGQRIPFKAAQLLEREMERGRIEADADNLELLAGAWAEAREREKAIAVYQRAMQAGASASLGLYVAQLHIEDEHWRDAASVLEASLQRGGLGKPGEAWLLLGVAYFESGKPELARNAFARATDYEAARSEARAWLDHLRETS
jgi:tetratricopeptide (TPR) repeat protein